MYSPSDGEIPSGKLKVVAAEEVPYTDTFLLKVENSLTVDGDSYNNIFYTEPKTEFENFANALFISGINVKTNGKNADFTEGLSDYTLTADFINESGEDVDSITLSAEVIRNNRIYIYDETDIIPVTGEKFSGSCVLNGYEPQSGDLIKVYAFDDSDRLIINSDHIIFV